MRMLCLTALLFASLAVQAQDGPLKHVVLVWFKPDLTAETRQMIFEESAKLRELSMVQGLTLGPAVPSEREVVDDSFSMALVIDFADVAALKAYDVDPTHKALVKNVLRPNLEKIVVYDYFVQ